jgi:glutaminase
MDGVLVMRIGGRISLAMVLLVLIGCSTPVPLATLTPPTRMQASRTSELDSDGIAAALAALHERFRDETSGVVADHNEVAAAVDPDDFGIAIAMTDGRIISVGDATTPFPLQSLSKVFNFALALEDHGSEDVLAKVGTHATGLPYGSLLATEVRATRLQNPMVSSGAIAIASMVTGDDETDKWHRMQETFSAFVGRDVHPLDDVLEAEMAENTGSLAKAWVLKMYGLLYCEPEDAVERYLRGCSVGVTAEDLAVMGATVANWGVNPRTGQRVISAEHASGVLSGMVTSGMYDDSGPWLYHIGLPAKSGVSGGVLAIVPGCFAIAVYSPPLDDFGNSVRATRVVRALSEHWGLHIFEPPATAATTGRSRGEH